MILDFPKHDRRRTDRIAQLEQEIDYLNSQLNAERLMRLRSVEPRQKLPMSIVICLWVVAINYGVMAVYTLYHAFAG